MVQIAVFGAGAIGCWLGGRLAAGGADVTLIGRPRVLEELAHGLTLTELDGPPRTLPVELGAIAPGAPAVRGRLRATTAATAAAHAELVLVTVKSAQTADAGAILADVLRNSPACVVSLQNGVHNAALLRAALPARPVLAGMVPWNVTGRGPGAYHRGSSGTLMLERARGDEALTRAMADAGLALEARTDIAAVQWGKLVLNLNNAINALSGQPLAVQLADRDHRRCLAAAQREALAVLAAADIPIARLTLVPPRLMPHLLALPDRVFRVLARRTIAIDPHARSSMWDDLEAGRPTEIAYLQGEIVALADRIGRAAPVNRALVQLVHAAEAGGRRDYRGEELVALTRPTA